jgi:hypothetical protein
VRWCTSVQAALAALPQGPSLRSELFCLGPSSLNRPHPPHSPAHRDFAGVRFIRNAFAVPSRPRRPTSGSGLSLSAPSLHVVLKDPGEPIDCTCPAPSSTASAFTLGGRARRLPTLPSNPFHEGRKDFGTSCFALATTCKVARLPDGSDPQGPTETFTPGLSTGRSPFPPPGMTTMVAGRLHRRDLHPLEHQLASLQPPIIPYGGFTPVRLKGWLVRQRLRARLAG